MSHTALSSQPTIYRDSLFATAGRFGRFPALDISPLYELRFPGHENSGGTGAKNIRDFEPYFSDASDVPAGEAGTRGEAS